MSAAYYPQVQKIYVAYYGRPADPAGLQYWAGQLAANGGSLTAIINAFGNSAESTALYAGADNAAKVTAIYQQLFNRSPDSAGLAFYVNELSLGRMTAASIALNVANGATGTDATYLTNKQAVASSFTDALTTDSAAAVAYAGTAAANTARALISGVTTSAATTNVASTIAAIKPGGGAAATGQTFTLTADLDTVVGTIRNDQITGNVKSATSLTFNTLDTIFDGQTTDNDTLTLSVTDDITTTPTVTNIENVVVNFNASTTPAATATVLNAALTGFSSGTSFTFNHLAETSVVETLTITGLANATTLTVDTEFANLDVDAATAGNGVSIKMNAVGSQGAKADIDNATTKFGDMTVTAAGYLDLTTIADGAVIVTAAKDATITATAAQAAVLKVLDGDLAVADVDSATVVRLTASGGITVTAGEVAAATTLQATAGKTLSITGTMVATSAVLSAGTGTSTFHEDDEAADDIVELTLSGNGAAPKFDLDGGNVDLNTLYVTGAQNVTAIVSATNIDGLTGDKFTVKDTSTGTFVLQLTGDGSVDVSDSTVDRIDLIADLVNAGTETLTVASGQSVVIAEDQTTNALVIDGKDSSAATNTLSITIDDDARDNSDVDITSLTITDFGTVSIDASIDTLANGTYNTFNLNTLTASDASSAVAIKLGVNRFASTTSLDVGVGGTITMTGSGTVTVAEVTAKSFNVSAVSGVVTATALDGDLITSVVGGSANDVLTFDDEGAITVNGGAGNDTIELKTNVDYSALSFSIDGGDGTADVLKLGTNGAILSQGSGKTVSISGIEELHYTGNNGTAFTISAATVSGRTWSLKDLVASKNDGVTVSVAATDTVVNLGTLTAASANQAEIAGETWTVDASANTSAMTIAGVLYSKNALTGGTKADSLTGGEKSDTLTGGAGNDTLLGGIGDDDLRGGVGADSIEGGDGNDTYTSTTAQVGSAVEGSGTGTSAGLVINLGSTSVSGTAVFNESGLYVSGASGSVAAGGAAYLFATDASTNSAVSDTLLSIENVTLAGNGTNYVIGSSSANSITGGTGADTIDGGGGSDTITGGAGNDSLDGGTGADTYVVLSTAATDGTDSYDFTVGTGGDVINLSAFLSGASTTAVTYDLVAAGADETAFAAEGTAIDVLNKLLVIKIDAGAALTSYDTAAEINALTANNGAWDALDFGSATGNSMFLIGADNGTTLYLYSLTAAATGAASTAVLVGTLTVATDGIDSIVAANYVLN